MRSNTERQPSHIGMGAAHTYSPEVLPLLQLLLACGAGERRCRGAGDRRGSHSQEPGQGLTGKRGSTLWNGIRENRWA